MRIQPGYKTDGNPLLVEVPLRRHDEVMHTSKHIKNITPNTVKLTGENKIE